jgi:hypothetical protein
VVLELSYLDIENNKFFYWEEKIMPAKSIKYSLKNILGISSISNSNNPSISGKYNSFNTGQFQNFTFARGGNEVLAPGNGYRYHYFTGTSTFVVEKPGYIDYFIVAGSGAGGNKSPSPSASSAAGGGAGGHRTGIQYFNVGTYTITVGGAGALGPAPLASPGGAGTNSSITAPTPVGFTSITANGGGGGGGASTTVADPGGTGGSGGGGASAGFTAGSGGTGNVPPYTPPQGGDGAGGGGPGSPLANAGPGGGGGGSAFKDATGIWYAGDAVTAFFDTSIPSTYGTNLLDDGKRTNYAVVASPQYRWFAGGGPGGGPGFPAAANTGHGGPRYGNGNSGIIILRYIYPNGNQIF